MKRYKFKYRRHFFWRSHTIIGHGYSADQDKMALYFEDGGIREVKEWKKCEIILGVDWVLSTKKSMESKAGQVIPLTVG